MARTPEYNPERFGERMSDIGRDTASAALMDTMAGRLHRDVRDKGERIGATVDIRGTNYQNPERRAAWDAAMKPNFDHYERAQQGPAHRALWALDGHEMRVARSASDLSAVPTLDTTAARVPAGRAADHDSNTKNAPTEADLFAFLTRKYTQQQDARKETMGLQYMTAETHDLAKETAGFANRVTPDCTTEAECFAFLTREYTQQQDTRQQAMGLQYMTAETHDLAKGIAGFVSGRRLDVVSTRHHDHDNER